MQLAEEAIILVGGLGTRLRTLVSDVPKPLAPVAGRPFLAWVLDALSDHGMRRVILAAGYRAEQVEAVIGRRWRSMDVAYSVEPEPLGTGGAIALARESLVGEAAHVLNGDSFLDYEPGSLQRHTHSSGATLGVALARVADVGRYGAARLRGGHVVGFSEKGGVGQGWINAGCYYLGPQALAGLPSGASSFESDVLAPAVSDGEVAGLQFEGRFIDIGVPDDFQRAQILFAR
ncbi:nucleotidyltransferase family protein [Pseudoxanthomonas sp. Root630]|uniref:nucleotidyltransferase family protein n=1 Tax=Pseudoxanthomonas sp. Root630 TaxID=1736574 RepID=UPI000A50686B|nr:nucleotidyltransferase family protein [Pseudoxanthomonas sp. Root630]